MTLMNTQELLYRRHTILGRIFSSEPIYVGLGLSAIWSLLLFGGAYVARVLEIPQVAELPHVGTGLLHRPNWTLMYPVILPLVFGIATWISRTLVRAAERLTWPENEIILTKDGKPPADYLARLSDYISERARTYVPVIAILVCVIFVADTKDIVYGVWRHSRDATYQFSVWDWSVAYAMHPTAGGWMAPSLKLNLAFDFIAYFVEATGILLGFYWVVTFWWFLKGVCDLMIPAKAPFKFNPLWQDQSARLGLAPLGDAFNYFLFQSLLFEVYIFFHRLQMIQWRGGPGSRQHFFNNIFHCLSNWDTGCLFSANRFDTLDNGLWMLLIFLSLPIIVISYLPLWQLRAYVIKQRDDLFDATARDLDDAIKNGDTELEATLRRKKKALRDACIWPNGELAGWFLFGSTCFLAFVAWFPAWLIPAVLGVVGFLFIMAISIPLRRKSEPIPHHEPKRQGDIYVTHPSYTYNINGNSGVINMNSWLKDVTQTIQNSPALPTEDQKALQKLMADLTVALKPASETQADDAAKVVKYAKDAADELSSRKPNKRLLGLSMDGLQEAAKAVALAAPTILTVVGQIVDFVSKTVMT
jgi:hypothetical protein